MRFYSSVSQETALAAPMDGVATTMTVEATTGFPAQTPYTLTVDADTISEEIVTVTAVAGTTLTVTRGEDGSVAQSHATGSIVRHEATARDFQESRDHEADDAVHSPNPHGNEAHSVIFATDADLASHEAATAVHSATSAPTASRIVTRDAASRAQVADPSVDADIATKGYVDSEIAAVPAPNIQVYTSATPSTTAPFTWNKPAGLKAIRVRVVGGGGAGGGAPATGGSTTSQGGGGGGGAYVERWILASELGATASVTAGGGAAGSLVGTAGSSGTTSAFHNLAQAGGGAGGDVGTSGSGGVRVGGGRGGSIVVAGDVNVEGSDGGTGIFYETGVLKQGDGGGTVLAGTASAFGLNTSGSAPNGYGGGSSGASNGFSASARGSEPGANGVVIVEEFF